MDFLIDTGVLLRTTNMQDAEHPIARKALELLYKRGDRLFATLQNVSEFWNVCTRPSLSRGGLGYSVENTCARLIIIEQTVAILPEPQGMYDRWKELVTHYRVSGVQVHDAKLVAAMTLHGVNRILTFNPTDFRRYAEITVITPNTAIA